MFEYIAYIHHQINQMLVFWPNYTASDSYRDHAHTLYVWPQQRIDAYIAYKNDYPYRSLMTYANSYWHF